MKAIDFETKLRAIWAAAQSEGHSYVDVQSGELHRQVGGYPSNNHRMPVCCEVMRRMMREGDRILQAPPKGDGATLVIRYLLPRPD